MAAVSVDGVWLPRAVADHPALELCNTIAGWDEDDAFDYLVDYEVLARHVGYLGLLGAGDVTELVGKAARAPAAAAQVLRRTRDLRTATYRLATGVGTDQHWEVVRRAVVSATAAGTVRPGETSLGQWVYDVSKVGLAVPLHLFAWQVQDLLTASPEPVVGRCPGRQCGWLFLNRGNRRWCIMATCGNREKARRHSAHRSRGTR